VYRGLVESACPLPGNTMAPPAAEVKRLRTVLDNPAVVAILVIF
jgi:hypothetical protein